jgi:predicted transcriptional regulator
MVKTEIDEVELSAGDWEKVREGIREIERGRYATLEEMKRDLLFDKRGAIKDKDIQRL